jgi:hypothetical protein
MKKRIKISLKFCKSAEFWTKTLENGERIGYAFQRYPVSVWHTVLVQNISSHAAMGDKTAGGSAKKWTWGNTTISQGGPGFEFR